MPPKDAFRPEDLRIIRSYLTPRRPTWDYWFSHVLYFVAPAAALVWGTVELDRIAVGLGSAGVLAYLFYLIHAGARYNRIFHQIIPTYERLLEQAQRPQRPEGPTPSRGGTD